MVRISLLIGLFCPKWLFLNVKCHWPIVSVLFCDV